MKYDDGGTRTGIPLKQLRPLEKAESDGTGLSYTSSHNAASTAVGGLWLRWRLHVKLSKTVTSQNSWLIIIFQCKARLWHLFKDLLY